MAKDRNDNKGKNKSDHSGKKRNPGSTTSLGKRRSRSKSPGQRQETMASARSTAGGCGRSSSAGGVTSTMSNPRTSEYGSQASPLRVPATPKDLVKVTVVGAAGGIGQPLALLLMMHSEYIHHLALYDLVDSTPGVGLDVSHIDRQVKISTHVGPESLPDAVRGASVIIVLAGLAQKPGMSRDDLFGSNAKIMYNIAKCCAQTAPDAMLCIVTNPVNSLLPLTCEVYSRLRNSSPNSPNRTDKGRREDPQQQQQQKQGEQKPEKKNEGSAAKSPQQRQQSAQDLAVKTADGNKSVRSIQSIGASGGRQAGQFEDCCRRIFGVTTLDVVRASTLTAKSAFFKNEPNSLFKDPGKIQVPVVGGHAGKTIMPLLSQATPKLDKDRLVKEKATTLALIEGIQQAGIDVLNAKKGKGSATLAMAYAACRFTVSLLRAMGGEQNIVECAYVRHPTPCCNDLEYFAVPLLLGKDGYVKMVANYLPCGNSAMSATGGSVSSAGSATNGQPASGSLISGGMAPTTSTQSAPAPASSTGTGAAGGCGGNKLLPFEQQMLDEGSRELRLSIAKGEDFAREHLMADK